MADDPWADFRTAAPAQPTADPWAEFRPGPKRGAVDQLMGLTGERYQTWPERLVRSVGSSVASGATLPGDVAAGKAMLPSTGAVPGSVPFGDPESTGGRVADLASLASPLPVRSAASLAKPAIGPPSQEALLNAGEQGFKTAKGMGVEFDPSAVGQMADVISATIEQKGANADVAPLTHKLLGRLKEAPPGSVATVENLHNFRTTLGQVASKFTDPAEQRAAVLAKQELDKWLSDIPTGAVVRGDAAPAAQALKEAIGNFAAGSRAKEIADIFETTSRNADVANSGLNVANITRQGVNQFLKNDARTAGFSPEELAQADRLARGTNTGNAARRIANLLGAGGGIGNLAGIYAGATVGGAPGAIVAPTIGALAKAVHNASTARQGRILDELVRSRSPLAESMASQAGSQSNISPARAALIRAMLESQMQNRGQ